MPPRNKSVRGASAKAGGAKRAKAASGRGAGAGARGAAARAKAGGAVRRAKAKAAGPKTKRTAARAKAKAAGPKTKRAAVKSTGAGAKGAAGKGKGTGAKEPASLAAEALAYHLGPPPGKISIAATKPLESQSDLALAYSPGVAAPSLAIARDPAAAWDYTGRGNSVAVVSNGTAVLGLGDLGPLASKPVMEGKAALFKRFAGIDAIDLEVEAQSPAAFIESVAAVARSFGGINLEDIKAPECFPIERELSARLDIPVFHDDQHGTAIIVLAGFINALDITGRTAANTRVVIVGAGAAAVAVAGLLKAHGLGEVMLVDLQGVLHEGRSGLDEWRRPLAVRTRRRTLAEALKGADALVGLSQAGAVPPRLLASMKREPILFLLANPDPEIPVETARKLRPDALIATGRSDYPNQVNNVLGFPYIFRGALDIRARTINTAMKRAAAEALAQMTRSDTPEEVDQAYDRRLQYGPDYIIPTPFDPRLARDIPQAVARAAQRSRVAGPEREKMDLDAYAERLAARQDPTLVPLAHVFSHLRAEKRRVIFAEGEEAETVRAAWQFLRAGYGQPILVGERRRVEEKIAALGLPPRFCRIVNAAEEARRAEFAQSLWRRHRRDGFLLRDAKRLVNRNRNVFAASLLRAGAADALVTGLTRPFHVAYEDVRLVVSSADRAGGARAPAPGLVFGFHLLIQDGCAWLLADTQLHESPDAATLAAIAREAAGLAAGLGWTPRVAFLSFSTFGNPPLARAQAARGAVRLLDEEGADFAYEGELEARVALDKRLMREHYGFSRLQERANVLILPSLNAASIAVQLLAELGGVRALGPFLHGLEQPVGIVPFGSGINDLVLAAAFAAHEAVLEEERAAGSAGGGKAGKRAGKKSASKKAAGKKSAAKKGAVKKGAVKKGAVKKGAVKKGAVKKSVGKRAGKKSARA